MSGSPLQHLVGWEAFRLTGFIGWEADWYKNVLVLLVLCLIPDLFLTGIFYYRQFQMVNGRIFQSCFHFRCSVSKTLAILNEPQKRIILICALKQGWNWILIYRSRTGHMVYGMSWILIHSFILHRNSLLTVGKTKQLTNPHSVDIIGLLVHLVLKIYLDVFSYNRNAHMECTVITVIAAWAGFTNNGPVLVRSNWLNTITLIKILQMCLRMCLLLGCLAQCCHPWPRLTF